MVMTHSPPIILTVAGSDPSAGAGLQADLKTIHALGGYGVSAVTAVTVQNSSTVTQVHPMPGALVADQMRAVLEDMPVAAIKLGMLGSAEVVEAVLRVLEAYPELPMVADTVLRGTGGGDLLTKEGVGPFVERLIPRATLITPNLDEAVRLAGVEPIEQLDEMESLAEKLRKQGAQAVLLTGGHLPGDTLQDLLSTPEGVWTWHAQRLSGPGFHGTGCTLASAVATGLAHGQPLHQAVDRGVAYVRKTLEQALTLGQGQRLLKHL
uniref:hydroxymethylpyrimidine kinase n=1 Tax=Magnetococcus massalia (strain MO-1) TaxID=451514 RepID=A0A1S7LPC8_MAGMO|nr:Phosphomethylpyrimidine kinase [Candidatus Magnetococcus massalia]